MWALITVVCALVACGVAWQRFEGAPALIYGAVCGLGVGLAVALLVPDSLMEITLATTVLLVGTGALAEWSGLTDLWLPSEVFPLGVGALLGLGLSNLNALLHLY